MVPTERNPSPGYSDIPSVLRWHHQSRVSAGSHRTQESCGTRRFYKQMITRAEARYFLNVCGVKQLDGDGDGRPCESLCQ